MAKATKTTEVTTETKETAKKPAAPKAPKQVEVSRSTIVEEVAANSDLSKAEVADVIKAYEERIVHHQAKGAKVQLKGFATFSHNVRAARTGRNPQTGADLEIPEMAVAKISVGREMKAEVRAGITPKAAAAAEKKEKAAAKPKK